MKNFFCIMAILLLVLGLNASAGDGCGGKKRLYLTLDFELIGMDGNHVEETCKIFGNRVVITSRINSGPITTVTRYIPSSGGILNTLINQSALEPLLPEPTQCDGGDRLLTAHRRSSPSFVVVDRKDCVEGSMIRMGPASESLENKATEFCSEAPKLI